MNNFIRRMEWPSLEFTLNLAHDTASTIAEARHLWTAVNRPNLLIKVPGTRNTAM